jgi:hypothetical protein
VPSKINGLDQNFKRDASQKDVLGKRVGSTAMSDEVVWNFVDKDDAKAEIRAAVEYLLRGATVTARNIVALEIMEIVRQVANGLPPQPNPFDDESPGG